MSVGSFTNDHEIKIDTTTKKFTLAIGANGEKNYRVLEEVPKYDRDIKVGMGDWKGGHGQLFFTKSPDVYYDGQSIDTTLDGKVILGPLIYQVGLPGVLDGNPVCSCWFSAISKLMVATAAKVYWYDGTNLVVKNDFTAIGTISDMVEYNGYLFVALGTSAAYYYSSDGAAYTACTLTDHHATKFLNAPYVNGLSNVLYKFLTPNLVSHASAPLNGAATADDWDSPTYVGDTSNNITNIFLVNDNLMIGRTDNLFNVDSDGGVHPLMDDLKHNRTTKNFQYVTQWQTATYCSLGTGLGELTSYNTYQPIGPLTEIDDIGKVGTCVGITSDKDFIYVAIDEGTNTHIYKGREVRRNGVLRWEWCPYVYLGTNDCATIKVVQHTATDRRLWFGSGNYFNYVILSDNPLADTSYTFAASGWLRMSYLYGSNPMWDKLYQTIVTETKGCSANITVTPKYRKDTDTSMTSLTSAITTNGVVHTNLTAAIACKRVQYELDLATNDSSKTPEITLFEVRGTEKPETIRIHEAVYTIGDMPSKKSETLKTFLRGGRTSTTLMCFADLRYGQTTSGTAGTDFVYVVMEPGYPQEIDVLHEKGRAPELGIKCRFIELNLASAAIDASAATLPTGVANTMIYYNGTSWATITASGVMALLSGSAGAAFSMNSQKITGVTDPGAAQDAATKNYVDNHAPTNLDWDTVWLDAVHSHASDAEGGALTTTLLDDTAGGTDALLTKAPTSNRLFNQKSVTETLTNKTLTAPLFQGLVDGWTAVTDSWTYASASTITVPSGAASIYKKGDKLKLTQTTVKYFYIIGVADTVLTVTGGSDYTVANAAISAIYYSHQLNPIGFPEYFNTAAVVFSLTYLDNGSGGAISSSASYFKIRESICEHYVTVGTWYKVGTNNIALFTRPSTLPTLVSIGISSGLFGTYNVSFYVAGDCYILTVTTINDNSTGSIITFSYTYLF